MNYKLSKYSINMLKQYISRRKDDIRTLRKERDFSVFLKSVEPVTIYHKEARQIISEIKYIQQEISERKEKGLYKLKDLREYWRRKAAIKDREIKEFAEKNMNRGSIICFDEIEKAFGSFELFEKYCRDNYFLFKKNGNGLEIIS